MHDSVTQNSANSVQQWNAIWSREGSTSWRGEALKEVYERIAQLIPTESTVADIGGGVGQLASVLRDRSNCQVHIFDHSMAAIEAATRAGHLARCCDVENLEIDSCPAAVVTATEVLEHLTDLDLKKVLTQSAHVGLAFFSVPNDRLGPEEEPQHCRKWTAVGFKRYLEQYFAHVRVECLGPLSSSTRAPAFLLAVCANGEWADALKKSFRLSVTLPVRDEAADLARTLASFRGVADEMIVGVDPRTSDGTREVAAKYADEVFDLVDPEGRTQPDPPLKIEGKDSVHFAWIRNQCIQRCTGDWIFMTEGHEYLSAGQDALLHLDQIVPKAAKIGMVVRRATGQRWAFPWLIHSSDKRLRYTRSTHNCIDPPEGVLSVKLPMIHTMHSRDHERERSRAAQRKSQNRQSLLEDWVTRGNVNSLFYLGTEWRPYDKTRSMDRFRQYIAVSKNGCGRYQARLILAKELSTNGEFEEAKQVLLAATGDDWSRVEHWLWLGDLAFNQGQYEQAEQFYLYSATYLGRELPFTQWWIDEASYTYLPAQRLAMTTACMGNCQKAAEWARRVVDLLPADAPDEALDEAKAHLLTLEEAAHAEQSSAGK